MVLQIDLAWLTSVLLLAARVAGATVLMPIFGPVEVPASVRVILAVAIAAALVSGLTGLSTAGAVASLTSTGSLGIAMLSEVVIGATFAFGFLAAYAATQVAGRVLDIQMGFSAASVFNPALRSLAPLTGSILGMLGIVMFLALDGHHLLLRALAESARATPPGTVFASDHFGWDALIAQSSVMFAFGLTLASPVMVSLLLADIAIAFFARSVPQLNPFVLGFAIKILLGLVGLAAAIRLSGSMFERLFATTFHYWEQIAPVAQ
jgi:flagellar biosynthetic protein FliR